MPVPLASLVVCCTGHITSSDNSSGFCLLSFCFGTTADTLLLVSSRPAGAFPLCERWQLLHDVFQIFLTLALMEMSAFENRCSVLNCTPKQVMKALPSSAKEMCATVFYTPQQHRRI
uniref:Secreted protein n=1 Tax=Peronospora matthiolae TaxID=2874970 RepID=A0AAV1U3G8_9STRA